MSYTKIGALLVQFLKFCVVGLFNVGITLAVYYLLVWTGCSPYIANTAGYFAGLVNAYIWNLRWVFQKSGKNSKAIVLRFLCVYIFSYFLSQGIIYFCVDVIRAGKMIAPLAGTAVTTPINFFVNKYWTFRERRT
jgi:putative flippase GtrA